MVTGAAGGVGRWVVRELACRGHEVVGCGRRPDVEIEGAAYMVLDCCDFSALRQAVSRFEAVVHLAAIPYPNTTISTQLFAINCQGTFNVYEACVAAGIHRLAVASSINALGQKFGVKPLPVQYFPIDEAHPQLCTDPYSFSKQITEEIGEYYWQRHNFSSVSIRLPWVADPVRHRKIILGRHSEDPRSPRLSSDYWTWLDARDSALAFALGIEASYEGFHALFTVDSSNFMRRPSRELAGLVYPEVTDWREPISGDEALISSRRARELLGWEPKYRFQDVFASAEIGEPDPDQRYWLNGQMTSERRAAL